MLYFLAAAIFSASVVGYGPGIKSLVKPPAKTGLELVIVRTAEPYRSDGRAAEYLRPRHLRVANLFITSKIEKKKI